MDHWKTALTLFFPVYLLNLINVFLGHISQISVPYFSYNIFCNIPKKEQNKVSKVTRIWAIQWRIWSHLYGNQHSILSDIFENSLSNRLSYSFPSSIILIGYMCGCICIWIYLRVCNVCKVKDILSSIH